jgi:hypothetical protein
MELEKGQTRRIGSLLAVSAVSSVNTNASYAYAAPYRFTNKSIDKDPELTSFLSRE